MQWFDTRGATRQPLGALSGSVLDREERPGATVLLVEADPAVVADPALQMLRQGGVTLVRAESMDDAWELLSRTSVQLVLVGALPHQAGLDLCRELVDGGSPPVILWSLGASLVDQVTALELGADDCIARTAHALEFVARIRAALRRSRSAPTKPDVLGAEQWLFNAGARRIRSWQGAETELSATAASLFRFLCEHPAVVHSREVLTPQIQGLGPAVAARTIDVAISRLRRRLETCDGADRMLRTMRPSGWLFDARVDAGNGLFLIRRSGE